jgi:hypothetical protein
MITVVLFLVSTLPGWAQPRRWSRMSPSYDFELTSEQIMRIEEMELELQQEILPLETDLEIQYLELKRMFAQNDAQAKIDAKLDQIDKMEIELDKKYQAHQMNIRSLLTDKQKMLFDQEGGFGWGLGLGLGRGYGVGYGRGYTSGYGRSYGRGYTSGYGRSYGRGYAPGFGRGYGRGYALGYGRGCIRGYVPGYGRGYGRGYLPDYSRGYGLGYGRGYGQGYGNVYGLGYGRAYGWGYGRGLGRGYLCPWRWR